MLNIKKTKYKSEVRYPLTLYVIKNLRLWSNLQKVVVVVVVSPQPPFYNFYKNITKKGRRFRFSYN